MPCDNIDSIENSEYLIDMDYDWILICNCGIIDTIDLRSTEWNRDRWLDEDVMARELLILSCIIELSDNRRKLDDIWLLGDISSPCRESCCLGIPDTNLHN